MAETTQKEKAVPEADRNGRNRNSCNIAFEEQFRNHMSQNGLETEAVIHGDGELHRFHITGDKDGTENGWYVLHLDNRPAGAAGSWKTGREIKWAADSSQELSENELAAIRHQVDQAKNERGAERAGKQAAAAKSALERWEAAKKPDPEHLYLVDKAVSAHGIRQEGGLLLIPGRNIDGELQTIQTINKSGEKLFMKNGKAKEAFHVLGERPENAGRVYICEGYATGCSLLEAGAGSVVVAFNSGNLRVVAEAVKDRYPDLNITVACDNDAGTEENPGLTKGREAAAAINAPYVFPEFPERGTGTDFNDLAASGGREAVAEQLSREFPTVWPRLNKRPLEPLPAFPWHTLPDVIGDHARQVAECYQVPPEFPAVIGMAVAAAAMGNRTFIELKKGVKIRPNLYIMPVLDSGARKSSVFRPMTEPLVEFAERHAADWNRILRERRIWSTKVTRLEKELAKSCTQATEDKLRSELDSLTEPVGACRDYLVENATEEALQKKLVECGEKACVFSADSRDVLQVLQGLYTVGENRETTYLKSFDGDSLRIDRMGRRIHLDRPAVSLLLCVQGDKLEELGGNAGLHAGGFIPRLVILVPDSLAGTRFWTEKELESAPQERYNQAILERLEKYRDQIDDFIFPLDPDAKNIWVPFHNEIERLMKEELEVCAASAARWQTLPARLAATIAEYSGRKSITEPDMKAAVELTNYLIVHGKRAAEVMGRGVTGDLARGVKHLRDKRWREFTPNKLRRVMNANAAEVEKWLSELEQAGYVRPTGERKGGKRTPVYEVNPQILN